jgi:Tfp pilus assembly protein PilF
MRRMRLLPLCIFLLTLVPLPARSLPAPFQIQLREFFLSAERMRDEGALAAAWNMLRNAGQSREEQAALVLLVETALLSGETKVMRATLDSLHRLPPPADTATARRLAFCTLELMRACAGPDECRRQLVKAGLDGEWFMSSPRADTGDDLSLLAAGRLNFRPLAGSPDGVVRPPQRDGAAPGKTVYLRRPFSSAGGQSAIIAGCAGQMTLFLDGRLLGRYESLHFGYMQHTIIAGTPAGEHILEILLRGDDAGEAACVSAAIFSEPLPANQPDHPAPGGSPAPEAGVSLLIDALLQFHDGLASPQLPARLRDAFAPGHPLRAAALHLGAVNAGSTDERMSLLRECLRENPDHVPALHDLALDCLRQLHTVKASELLEKALAIAPRAPRLLLLRQKLLFQLGLNGQAGLVVQTLQQAGYTDQAILAAYMKSWYEQNKRSAFVTAANLHRISPCDTARAAELRQSLPGGAGFAERESALTALLTVFPDSTGTALDLARLYLAHNRRAEAVTMLSALEHRTGPHPGIHLLLARAAAASGAEDSAAWHCAQVSALDPSYNTGSGLCALYQPDTDPLRELRGKPDIAALAARARQFAVEPAVTLYEEHIIQKLGDGSCIAGRRSYRLVNDPARASAARHQSFVLDRAADRILHMNATTAQSGNAEYRLLPLAGAESGLYHNFSAVEILAPQPRPGDIVMTDHIVHYAAGRQFRGYTGGRIVYDSPFRALQLRMVCAGEGLAVRTFNASFAGAGAAMSGPVRVFETRDIAPRPVRQCMRPHRRLSGSGVFQFQLLG